MEIKLVTYIVISDFLMTIRMHCIIVSEQSLRVLRTVRNFIDVYLVKSVCAVPDTNKQIQIVLCPLRRLSQLARN